MLWISMLNEDDDEFTQGLKRALGDVTFVFDIDNISFVIDAPVPIASTLVDLLAAFKKVASGKKYKRDTARGRKGDYQGLPAMIEATAPFRSVSMSLFEAYVNVK